MQRIDYRALLIALAVAVFASACATLETDAREDEEDVTATAPAEPEPAEPEEEAVTEALPGLEPVPRPRGFTGDNLYRLLVAELAGGRGDLQTALTGYLEAARDARDPRLAERAARLAEHIGADDVAIEAAERWVELQPRRREPHALLTRLYLQAGEVERATVHARAVIDYSSDLDNGLREIAAIAGRIDDPQVVIAVLESLLADYPDAVVLHYTIAFQAADAGDYARALTAADDALAIDPDYARALLLRAEVLAETGREEEAVEEIAAARERLPDDRELALGEVRLFINVGDHAAANQAMRETFEQFGNDGYVVNTLGRTAMATGALDDARIYFQRQLAMDGRPDEARYQLGRIAERQGDCEEAMAQYIQVGGREYRFDAQQRFAGCLAETGRIDEARLHLDRMQQSYPGEDARIELQRTRAEIEWSAGNLDDALRILSNLVDTYPAHDGVRYTRAIVAAESGHFELAREDLELMLEQRPDAPHLQNALGYTLADEGVELERARELIESALAQRPEDAAILDSMGWVLYRQGEYEQALEYLREAWALSGDAEIGAHLGEVLWVLGERSEARQIWNAAAEDDPDHRVLRETRERLDE